MTHDIPLINTLAAAFSLALIFGYVAVRLKMPALVGYLAAGVAIGPFTPGFVADSALAAELAEIGVMLLMFGVGLHFSPKDLLAVRRIALPGAILQIAVATGLGALLAGWWGWNLGAALIFGLSLSVASTVVLLRALESRGVLDSMNGRIAVGWLVVEDLVMVVALVMLPALASILSENAEPASTSQLLQTLAITLLKVALFIGLMLVVGLRILPKLLWLVARTGSHELFRLCVIAAAIGIAVGAAALFGVSFALGAFFAGTVLRESEFSYRAAEESLPLRDAFAVLFFVSVGMLLDPRVIMDQPLELLSVLGIILFGKSIAAAGLVLAFRYPLNTALIVSASLAQIGEFSFILVGLGMSLGMLPEAGRNLVLAGAIISIALNPLLFALIDPFQRWALRHSAMARAMANPSDELSALPTATEEKYLSRQAIVVGYGGVGRRICEEFEAQGVPYVVIEQNRALAQRLREKGKAVVMGNVSDIAVLIQAHIARAGMLVISVPDLVDIRPALDSATQLNPALEILVRTNSKEEAELLEHIIPGQVFIDKAEVARSMAAEALRRFGKPVQSF
jgi:CPA2 family monovalent cation:H+ antiporter-2